MLLCLLCVRQHRQMQECLLAVRWTAPVTHWACRIFSCHVLWLNLVFQPAAQIKRFPGRVLWWRSREHSFCPLFVSRLTVSRWGRRRSRGNGTKISKTSRLRTFRWSTAGAAPARRSSPASTRSIKREKRPQPQWCAAAAVPPPPSLQPLTARSWRFTRSLDQITWQDGAAADVKKEFLFLLQMYQRFNILLFVSVVLFC